MNEDLKKLEQMGKDRESVYYAWLRHLILMATGSLSVLVALHQNESLQGPALWAMRSTWTLLGLGILSASVGLYGEVYGARKQVSLFGEALSRQMNQGIKKREVVSSPTPRYFLWSADLAYLSLTGAVISLVVFAWLKN